MGYDKNLYDIVDGPSRDLLWDHLKYRFDKGVDIPLAFSVEQAGKKSTFTSIMLNSIAHEDGSGHSFIMKGYLTYVYADDEGGGTADFDGYYNTKHRTGYIRITKYSRRSS